MLKKAQKQKEKKVVKKALVKKTLKGHTGCIIASECDRHIILYIIEPKVPEYTFSTQQDYFQFLE